MFKIIYSKNGVNYSAIISGCANVASAEAKFIQTRKVGRSAIKRILPASDPAFSRY